ncbi:MAG: ABC transporter permease [Rhodospirillales bacterium]
MNRVASTVPLSGAEGVGDGRSLKASLNRALRRQKLKALALILPLLVFVLLTFVAPVVSMLLRSVDNAVVPQTLPLTVEALEGWDSDSDRPPGEAVFAALAADLKTAVAARRHMQLGGRLNYERTGTSSLFRKTGRRVAKWDLAADAPFAEKFEKIDKDWVDPDFWRLLVAYSGENTSGYFLNAVDMQWGEEGIELRGENERIYLLLLERTLFMSLMITLLCLLLGYPVAWLLSSLSLRASNILLILVLLPFWTSLLVRTSAWKVLLQQQGVINDVLVWAGLVADENRLALINNQTGTIIAMTHILLPFMILPLYSVMKTISPTYLRAAKSLGASDTTAFLQIYLPQTVPGIGAGSILVFILSIGYYITPELVGGTDGVFISNRIAYHISTSLNWGLAAALGVMLLVLVLALYWAYDRIVGIDNVKLG